MFTPIVLSVVLSVEKQTLIRQTMSNNAEEEVEEETVFVITKKNFPINNSIDTKAITQYFLHNFHLHDEYVHKSVFSPPNYL